MTRDEIYDHLAQVYLGKRKGAGGRKKKKQFSAWLLINIVITVIIFASIMYGLTAFLTKRNSLFRNNVVYALHNGPIRIPYNLHEPFAPVKTFSLSIPEMDISKYSKINFSIRGTEEGTPGIVKIVIKNKKNEISANYVEDVGLEWQEVTIPFEAFKEITDWSNVSDVSFVLESWNVYKKKGSVLIDNLSFSTKN